MASDYTIALVARNEGIDYRDATTTYRFNFELSEKSWQVFLPGSKGDDFRICSLSESEAEIILPRIRAYLSSRKYFGLFGPTFPVLFVNEPH